MIKVFAVAFACNVVAPVTVAAQPSRGGAAFTVGRTWNLSKGFASDHICPTTSASSVSGRITVALTRIIQLELLGEAFTGQEIQCVNGLVPPVPPNGPYTYARDFYDEDVSGAPTTISFRVGGSFPNAALRPYVGFAWLPVNGITMPQAGVTVLGGGRLFRLLFEVEGWWYSVPKQHLEEEYFDGRLIRRTLTERGVYNFTTIFRLGIASNVGRD
jgi:hypothetical protein